MSNTQALTKTLVFPLDVQSDNESLLHEARLECRRVFNEVLRLNYDRWDWGKIQDTVEQNADLVQNTAQCIIDKAFDALNTYYDNDDWGRPWYKHEQFPLEMNYTEGYNLFFEDETVRFRISAKPYNHVEGDLRGTQDQFNLLRQATEDADWHIGTAEVLCHNGREELHVTVTNETAEIADKQDAQMVIGVDVNEDCVGLCAVTDSGIEDSVVIEHPEVKTQRHEYFTIRKRMQSVGQTTFENELQDEERQFVHDQLHQLSREIVEWAEQFENPVIVFENLKDMRDSIDYGTRMNRRLHSVPFAQLQEFVSYKAAWDGIPSEKIDPAYTSQECVDCGHTTRSNRTGKRFQCVQCGFQDHADRKAALLIGARGLKKLNQNVPALNSPPVVRVRRQCNGLSEPADHNPVSTVRGHQTEGATGSVRN